MIIDCNFKYYYESKQAIIFRCTFLVSLDNSLASFSCNNINEIVKWQSQYGFYGKKNIYRYTYYYDNNLLIHLYTNIVRKQKHRNTVICLYYADPLCRNFIVNSWFFIGIIRLFRTYISAAYCLVILSV